MSQELEQQTEQMRTRSKKITINPLNNLLSNIGADIDEVRGSPVVSRRGLSDEPPKIIRKAKVKPNPNADWAAKEIQITVNPA